MRRFLRLSSVVLALSFGPVAYGADVSETAQPEAAKPASTKAADEAAKTAAPTNATPKLDVEVIALLRRTAVALESRSIEPAEEASFRALITAGDLLREDKTLAPSERERLRALCRVRLAQAGDVLKRQTAKETAASKADGGKKIVARNAVLRKPATVDPPASTNLAQQLPGGLGFGAAAGGGNGAAMNATRASAEDLMEIITSSIKPESWETNGGTGVIRYFSIGHALVVRATADAQGGVADLIGQLRN